MPLYQEQETTNLLHSLTSVDSPFTAMSRWEIILAPSIIQKKIYRFFWDYSPFFLKKVVKNFDKIIFKKLNNLHRISFFKKEEDEMIMMWALASVYMSFFYPESNVMRDLFRFEMGDITVKRKHRILKIYYRMVQRHLYAFGEDTTKRFLSKKPINGCKDRNHIHLFSRCQNNCYRTRSVVMFFLPQNLCKSCYLILLRMSPFQIWRKRLFTKF